MGNKKVASPVPSRSHSSFTHSSLTLGLLSTLDSSVFSSHLFIFGVGISSHPSVLLFMALPFSAFRFHPFVLSRRTVANSLELAVAAERSFIL
jgi:hypothetical protein